MSFLDARTILLCPVLRGVLWQMRAGRHRSKEEVVQVEDSRRQMRAGRHRSKEEVVQVEDTRWHMRAGRHRSKEEVVQK